MSVAYFELISTRAQHPLKCRASLNSTGRVVSSQQAAHPTMHGQIAAPSPCDAAAQFSFLPANGIGKARRRPAWSPSEQAEHGSFGFPCLPCLAVAVVAAGSPVTTVAASSRVPPHVALAPVRHDCMTSAAGASRPSVPSRCNATRPGREHASPSRGETEVKSGFARPVELGDHSLRGSAPRAENEGRCGHLGHVWYIP
jgi:hypothetical protein